MARKTYDPTSAEPVLYYGGEGQVAGVPAADLSANDLARLVWVRGDRTGDPGEVGDDAIGSLRDELAATGLYRKTPPGEPAQEAEE
jgi:hypothetical protein